MMTRFTDKPVQTFTVGFSQAGGRFLDERVYARELAARYNLAHQEIEIAPDANAILPEIVEAFDEPFADDHRNERLRGKVAHMKVTLRGLQVRQLPALDDDFARQVGVEGLETLEALRGRIRADLERREKRKADGDFKDALIKAALARNDFEVPPSLVERTIDNMLESTVERFSRMGLDVAQLDLDVARLRADLREQALLQVRGSLLLDAVAEAEKIEVGAEDVQAELARVAEEAGVPVGKVQQQMRSAEARAALHTRVREEKALSLLAEAASVTAA
jgi:trigger factor